jgi:hypothetical protein
MSPGHVIAAAEKPSAGKINFCSPVWIEPTTVHPRWGGVTARPGMTSFCQGSITVQHPVPLACSP